MLGDTAVAVHPDDPRFKHLIGKQRAPAAGRPADPRSSPTNIPIRKRAPARSRSRRRTTSTISRSASATRPRARARSTCSTREARVDAQGQCRLLRGPRRRRSRADARWSPTLDGLDRFEARKRIVEHDGARGAARQDRAARPHGAARRPLDVVIEPWLTDQWYVDAKTLAAAGARGGARGPAPQFVPKNWEKTYFDWLENIQPWCVSRQLWWGHQIPAWYAPWGDVYVEETEEAAFAAALADGVERGVADARPRPTRWPTIRDELRRDVPARRGRARHLVLLGAVAVLDARLAGRDAGARSASIRPTCSSPASTSSSSGSPA